MQVIIFLPCLRLPRLRLSCKINSNVKPFNNASLLTQIATGLMLIVISLSLLGCHQTEHDNVDTHNLPDLQDSNLQDSHAKLNVVSPDWGIAATLTDMGYPPIATGDIRLWDKWAGKPKLPASVIDLGIRYQPNAELVAQLPVDMVIDNFFYAHARNLYGDVVTEDVLFSSEGKPATWEHYIKPTQKLAQLIHQADKAEAYLAKSKREIEQAARQLHQRYPNVKKFAVAQFIDANNMRMFTKNSLVNVTFSVMGYDFVALGEGNTWGFLPIQVADLAKLEDDVCLLIIEPLSPLTEQQLPQNMVWQRLGYANLNNDNVDSVASRCVGRLEPLWLYGGISSIRQMADNVASAKLIGGVAR